MTAPDEDSVLSRVMNTRVAQVDRDPTQVGAVLVFQEGITQQEAEARIAEMDDVLESKTIDTFNPKYGYPVFYIP